MTRDQLEHAIRAACEVAEDTELIIFGSQAILGTYPDAPEQLRTSVEVDMQPKNFPENADLIDGSLGENSLFHDTHGFYVHGLSIESARLPSGWQDRTVAVSDARTTLGKTGYCLDACDLAASKLAAGREKDRVFVTTLLKEQLIAPDILRSRVAGLPIEDNQCESIQKWIEITAQDLA